MSIKKRISEQTQEFTFRTGLTPDTIILSVNAAFELGLELGDTYPPPPPGTLPEKLYGMRPVILGDVIVALTGREDDS